MIKKLAFSFVAVSSLLVSFAASSQARPASADPVAHLECSDPGRSCSVDRNCCSGSCDKGTCQ